MKISVVLSMIFSCVASAQLLPMNRMLFLGQDGHDLQPHRQMPLLGQDGHDQQHHGQMPLLGQDGHDQQHNGQMPLLGQDGHDQHHHGQMPLLGQDGHDQHHHGQKHGKHNKHKGRKHMLGGDDHDLQHHDRKLGGDDHDRKAHKKLQHMLGQGDHDYKKHGKKMGGDLHDLSHIGVFKNFMKTYNKSYNSQAEFKKRFSIFRENMRKVYLLQQNERGSAKYGPTRFADLTEQEFRKMLGFRPDLKPEHSSANLAVIPQDIEVPTRFDWRDHGVVTPVKDQGMCGSCWAFSVTGNVEGQWAIKHKHLYSLSEQELVDCDKSDEGCHGGLPENAYEEIKRMGGLETESDYPYDAEEEKCHFNKSLVKVTVNGSLELPQDEVALAKWLMKNGPISIGINANPLQFYTGGVSHPLKFLCNPKELDHGMLIVGFGVHTTKYLHRKQPYWIIKNSWGADWAYPVFKKTLPFWIVKNSWGENWGEQGYYRVYRGDGTCGVNQMATSAVVP